MAKRLADGASRRRALRALAGGAAATALGVFGLGAVTEVSAEQCRKFRERCDSDGQCCSRECVNFDGVRRCDCLSRGAKCRRDAACCSNRCRNNGKCA